jgi:hypothetical protein
VAVSAASSEILTDLRLYVDGQQMDGSEDGTNFLINTCEWWNGQHTIFAVARSQSGFEGIPHGALINYGRAASMYVNKGS